jgi:hypothetical protein
MKPTGTISPSLKHWRKRAVEFRSRGLTTRGRRRKRAYGGLTKLTVKLRQDHLLNAWNRRVIRLRAQGLTTRGTERVYAVRRGDALLLRSQIDDLAGAIAVSFADMSAPAQARALALERALSEVRRQLV